MRIIAFLDPSLSFRIGVLWKDRYVLDLEKALARYFHEELDMKPPRAFELAGSLLASDMVKFIERWPLLRDSVNNALRRLESIEPDNLMRERIVYGINEIRFLPVVPNPPKIVGIGLNYEEYRVMLKYPKPEVPLFFFKPSNTLIGHEDYIIIPRGGKWKGTRSNVLFHEYEMAIIIGRRAKFVDKEEAHEYIFGVTIFSDITAHDIEMVKPGFVLYQQRAKAFDTFSPVGPWIVTMDEIKGAGIDIHNLRIVRRRNGVVEGESNTRNMIYSAWEIVEFLSEIMTLEPGDIISLGSPPAGPPEGLQPSDIIEAEIEFIGVLRNYVK